MRKTLIFLSILAVSFNLSGCRSARRSDSEVVIWHWMSDRHQIFEQLAKEYNQKSETPVNFRLFPHAAYTQRVDAAAAARDLPDLFGILGEKRILASFAQEGLIADISPYLLDENAEWKNRFKDIALGVNSFEEDNVYGVSSGIYAVPIDMMSIQFLYNEDLIEKAGFNPSNPPQTFEDFLSIASAAEDMPGVYGFASGWGETWMIECLATNYAFNVMGEDKFFATIKGEVPYTDPDWIKVFSIFQSLEKTGVLAPDIVTMNNKEAEEMFATGRAFFTFNGSWGINTYAQINPELKYAAMLPPKVKGKSAPVIWAGAGSSFVLNANSKNKKEAIEFLKWLTDYPQQKFLTKKTKNLPAIEGLEEIIPDNLVYFSQNQEYFTHPRLWPQNEIPRVIETMSRGIQNILIGAATPDEVAEQVDRVKQRYLD